MTTEILITILLFLASYIFSVTFTSVFYHRALCHNALELSSGLKKFILRYGFFVTAIDPAIWICTHRMHHVHSDEEKDPHSPKFFPSLLKIHNSHINYYKILNSDLKKEDSKYQTYISDLGFSLHPWMRLPLMPFLEVSVGNAFVYLLHLAFYFALYYFTGSILYPLAIGAGLLGHPVQGTMVNYFGHIGNRFGGYRNFETPDQSVNNTVVAICIFGEGYQNNHHHNASAVKFSMRKGEYDFGYTVCLFLRKLGLVDFNTPVDVTSES